MRPASGCEEAAISRIARKKMPLSLAKFFFAVRSRKHSRSISQLYSRPKLFTADSVPR